MTRLSFEATSSTERRSRRSTSAERARASISSARTPQNKFVGQNRAGGLFLGGRGGGDRPALFREVEPVALQVRRSELGVPPAVLGTLGGRGHLGERQLLLDLFHVLDQETE